jgi:hypothetical protein
MKSKKLTTLTDALESAGFELITLEPKTKVTIQGRVYTEILCLEIFPLVEAANQEPDAEES